MKLTKKLTSLLLALLLTLSLATTAFAANSNNGKITITNAVKDQTYTIYQILALESYNTENEAYSYKATEAWKAFVESDEIDGVYLATDDQGYVTWLKTEDTEATAAFAKLAQAYAAKLSGNQGSKKAESTTVVFTGLNLGWYLVDTTLGTICSLDTTAPTVEIEEKNAAPESKKEVQEDSDGHWGPWNDADMGQTVNFRGTITAQAGAENYVYHDEMSAGLTFGSVTGITLNGETVDAVNYTVKTGDELTDDCTFEVVFTQDFCDTLKADDKIVISYTATLNENAVVGLPGNPNDSWLEYGQKGQSTNTPKSETITYTWDMDVLKYGNGDETKVLSDAEFVLLNNDKTKVATVVNDKLTGWVDVPTAGEDGTITWPENTVLTTDENGKIEIDGLDSDIYYLREIKAPDGYNKLSEDVKVEITGATGEGNSLTYTTVETKINNQSGTKLPTTGGVGTTIFYIAGIVLVLGAAVLLITRKRMGQKD